MDAKARAGIEFTDSVLRYAEVEHYGSRFRLLRLGTCDFDFDLVHDLLYRRDPDAVEVVREALQDVFSGSIASVLNAALHPELTTSFFTSVPTGITRDERQRRLTTEAILLSDAASAAEVNLSWTEIGVRRENDDVALSVLATPSDVQRGFVALVREMPHPTRELRLSTQGAAAIMEHLWRRRGGSGDPTKSVAVGIGGYHGRAEFVVSRRGEWIFSHHTIASTSADYAYFLGAILSRIGIYLDEVGSVHLYGDALPDDCIEALEVLLDASVERLNPLEIVDLDPDTLTGEFAAEAYVPCIGAAL